jgi:hypothetical protein
MHSFVPANQLDVPEGWLVVHVQGRPTPEGWPMPYWGDVPYDGWLNRNEPINGGLHLSEMFELAQHFAFIVEGQAFRAKVDRME